MAQHLGMVGPLPSSVYQSAESSVCEIGDFLTLRQQIIGEL